VPHFTQIVRDFGDGAHVFAFPIGAWRELEDKRKASIPEICMRFLPPQKYLIDDVRETIRIALVHGGGVKPVQALRLVERYVDNQPIEDSAVLAVTILMAAQYGGPANDAPQKKSEDEKPSQESSPTFASSTATVQ